MGQVRFRVEQVGAGSAARQAEQEARASGTSRPLRIQAGSAARMAEEAKRNVADCNSPAPTISLRAQGGRIQRVDFAAASAAAVPPVPVQHSELPIDPVAASPGVSPDFPPSQAGSPHSGASRLKTFLRGLFHPEETSQT